MASGTITIRQSIGSQTPVSFPSQAEKLKLPICQRSFSIKASTGEFRVSFGTAAEVNAQLDAHLPLRKPDGRHERKLHARHRRAMCMSETNGSAGPPPHMDCFQNVRTEEELLQGIRSVIEAKRLPPVAGPPMEMFYRSYRKAVEASGVPDPQGVSVKVMATVFDRILVQFEDPFTFPSHHRRLTEPYDYYAFGQNYVRPLIDFRNSYLGNTSTFDKIDQQLRDGHNVVLLANHQTEADPAVMALMLEASHPRLATDLTYVAGDRVVLDPFCKPFSMGRNLLCVYSKKRMNDVPELREQKMAANRRTLKEMARLLSKGGLLIWIAPSGGRDRPDPVTGEWRPAPFDAASVEMMRRLLHDAGPPGHLYPLALLCHDIMPPPRTVEKQLGEQRIIGFHGVAVSVAPELDFVTSTAAIPDKKEAREAFSELGFTEVVKQYMMLKEAVHGGQGLAAALSGTTLSQPWASDDLLSPEESTGLQEHTPAVVIR